MVELIANIEILLYVLVMALIIECINTFVQSGTIAHDHVYGAVMVNETNIRPRNHDRVHLTLYADYKSQQFVT